MKELKDIIASFDKAQKQRKQTALATVVQVEGSSYREPGARMLVTEDGELTGAISGGCLEGDALRKARLAMFQQKPMLVTYDTTDEDDAKLGVGLGCNGIIQILIEPLGHSREPSPNHPIRLLKEFLGKRQTAVLVTLFSLRNKRAAQPGTMLLLKEDGHASPASLQTSDPNPVSAAEKQASTSLPTGVKGGTNNAWPALDEVLRKQLIEDAKLALKTRTPAIKNYSGKSMLTGFIELLEPPISLYIFGAGNDAIPLAEMAAVLGWETTVADGRDMYTLPERFPTARVVRSKPEQALEWMKPDRRTAVVLMTHNYRYDLAMLRQLLQLELPYIGSLGPKKKLDRMLDELQEEDIAASPGQLRNLYGPTGLDIGAEGPEEIALSVLSEIKAVLSGSPGTPLREKPGPIHLRRPGQAESSTLSTV